MSISTELIHRNSRFAQSFERGDMPALPELRTVIVGCADARVDPAHVLDLDLGEAVVIRNTGGRVTRAVIKELATLAALVDVMTEGRELGFNVILMQHTQCGAQRLGNPELRTMLQDRLGIDVAEYVITDQATDLIADIRRLAAAREVPDALIISAMLYDVATGTARTIAPEKSLGGWRGQPTTNARDCAT